MDREKLKKLIKWFDCKFYLKEYKDLANCNVKTEEEALLHFLNNGIVENRNFQFVNGLTFEWEFYMEIYPELSSHGILNKHQAMIHYFNTGFFEGRVGNKKELEMKYNKCYDQAVCSDHLKIKNQKGGHEEKINILIRTSNRPKHFEKCIQSILSQNYNNYNIYICYDNIESLSYLQIYEGYENIHIFPIKNDSLEKYKFNLYNNFLLSKINQGYIFFLDDDDLLLHDNVLTIINNHLGKHRVMIWSFLRTDSIIGPKQKELPLKLGEICNSSVCFYHELKSRSKWDGKQCADFRYFSNMFNDLNPITIFFSDYVLTGMQFSNKVGNWGNNPEKKKETINLI